jgi:hypothetical protein
MWRVEGHLFLREANPAWFWDRRLVDHQGLKPSKEAAAGLVWIRDHLYQTTPEGCGLPIEAMNFIETAIKKGMCNANDMHQKSRLRRI